MIYEIGRLQRRPEVAKPGNSFGAFDTFADYVPEVELPADDGTGSGADVFGAFYHVYDSGGKWWLQGGTVTGTASNRTVDDIDIGAVGAEPADGTHRVLRLTGNAEEEDDVIIPGFTLTAHSDAALTTVPDDDEISSGDLTGKYCYVDLGSWMSGVFRPAASGNITITYCLGVFRKSRE